MKLKNTLLATVAAAGLTVSAQAGTFANITIDGDFSDWSTIPIAFTDANEGFTFDISTIQIANNDTTVFFRVSFFNAVNPNSGNGLFLGIDNDSNASTGFDVYSLGIVGTEGAYQNDFPFEQASGNFNTGASTNAPIAISPYAVSTNSQEFSVSRSAVIDTANGDLLFPNSSFNFAAYFNDADSDFAGAASYTFAAVPEPSTYGLLGLGLLAVIVFARRRRQLS